MCIPGGPAVIGSDTERPNERPRHQVEISTFYLDRFEVTNEQYARCEKAGACPRRIAPDPSFLAPTQPAVPLTWHAASAYCGWAGKRLPTEAEWEKAARGGPEGRTYPWGEEPPDCTRAQYDPCPPLTTRPVGSFAAGAYGLHDMAGNGYEWVADWESGCYEGCTDACGAACLGRDPQGPCGGAPACPGRVRRTIKGGSWFWPPAQMRGSWRRPQKPASGVHRLSVRCASSTPAPAAPP